MAAPVNAMDVDMPVKTELMEVPIKIEDTMNIDMADIPVNVSGQAKAIKQEHNAPAAVAFVPRALQLAGCSGARPTIKEEDVEMIDGERAEPSVSGWKLKPQAQLNAERAARRSRRGLAKGIKKRQAKQRKRQAKALAAGAPGGKKSGEDRVLASASGSRIGKSDTWRTAKPLAYQGELSTRTGKQKGTTKRRTKFMAALERKGDFGVGKAQVTANGPELDADLMDCFKAWNLGSKEEKGKEVAAVPGQNTANGQNSSEKDTADIANMLGAMKLGGVHTTE